MSTANHTVLVADMGTSPAVFTAKEYKYRKI